MRSYEREVCCRLLLLFLFLILSIKAVLLTTFAISYLISHQFRQYEMGECTRAGFCNFMHLKVNCSKIILYCWYEERANLETEFQKISPISLLQILSSSQFHGTWGGSFTAEGGGMEYQRENQGRRQRRWKRQRRETKKIKRQLHLRQSPSLTYP